MTTEPTASARPLRVEERQKQVADLVLGRGTATAQELAEHFGVSVMTIHRDLDELERQGVLRKSRGVATAQPSGTFESNVSYRLKTNATAKHAIGRHAATLVEPGMAVLLDDSTTVLAMIEGLVHSTPLRVVTNYLEAIRQLAPMKGVSLMALGGDYEVQHDSFLGMTCIDNIASIRVDACFVSTSAVSGGFAYHPEQRVVAMKRAMLAVATKKYLLVDHSKLGKVALHRIGPLAEFDAVVVDEAATADEIHELEQHGGRVEVAPG